MSEWNPAKIWVGDVNQRCAGCGQFILSGEWTKQNKKTGFIYHDDEAEDMGAYRKRPDD